MNSLFQGDPAISLTPEGATLTFKGGQPVMDQGLENQALISLFTASDWPGNFLLGPDQQIGSDFEEIIQGPITLSSLAELEKTAIEALDAPIFGEVQVTATNPVSWQIIVNAIIKPPTGNKQSLLLINNGQNWINQAEK